MGVIQEWVIKIPGWHPVKTNELLSNHWSRRTKMKDVDVQMIWGYFQRVPSAQVKRSVKLEIGLGYRERGGDPDAYFKSLLDALVKNRQLVDDTYKWVQLEPVGYYRTKDGTKETVITIREEI